MSIGFVGTKVGMTQIFNENGDVVPVTVIKAEPNQITSIRTQEKNGYTALQIGIGEKKKNRITKPIAGQYAKVKETSGVDVAVKSLVREFRVDDITPYKEGDFIKADIFEVGEIVDVEGTGKGKGFQGVIKRYNFSGGPGAHGSQFHRAPGSVGQCAWPSRVFPGKKLPGRMGGDKVTVKNLKVIAVDVENGRILIRGAVPGPQLGTIYILKKKR
jgi:large subunit ribosomal protein L3